MVRSTYAMVYMISATGTMRSQRWCLVVEGKGLIGGGAGQGRELRGATAWRIVIG